MPDNNDPRRNGSGCWDLTAYEAIKNIEGDEDYERAKKLIKTLQNMSHLADFEILNRMVLKDKRTGRIYK